MSDYIKREDALNAFRRVYMFIAVPDHGRLIDADSIDWVEGRDEQDRPVYLLLKVQIDDIPTIIPAEEGE